LEILWVWSVDKEHDIGEHQYDWVMDRFVNTLLPKVPRVVSTQTMHFPTEEQWQQADLVVFYLQPQAPWGKGQFDLIDAYQARGGGLVFLHLAILQGTGEELAKRIGLAFGMQDAPNGHTRWGALPGSVELTPARKDSTILRGLPETMDFADELYWNLRGDSEAITILGTSPGGAEGPSDRPPGPEELDGNAWPVMWTMEKGPGRTFAAVIGHNYFIFNDPLFRILLLRAMAWAVREPFDPFKPLVTLHLEQ